MDRMIRSRDLLPPSVRRVSRSSLRVRRSTDRRLRSAVMMSSGADGVLESRERVRLRLDRRLRSVRRIVDLADREEAPSGRLTRSGRRVPRRADRMIRSGDQIIRSRDRGLRSADRRIRRPRSAILPSWRTIPRGDRVSPSTPPRILPPRRGTGRPRFATRRTDRGGFSAGLAILRVDRVLRSLDHAICSSDRPICRALASARRS